jgi:uncharacterized protein (TIGR00369 family)
MMPVKYGGDNWCFACGEENPIGLRLKFDTGEDEVVSRLTLDRRYQGWPGIAHGGIVVTLLDEAAAHAICNKTSRTAVTGEMEIRLRNPTPLHVSLILRGRVDTFRHRLAIIKSSLETADGLLLAEGTTKFMVPK